MTAPVALAAFKGTSRMVSRLVALSCTFFRGALLIVSLPQGEPYLPLFQNQENGETLA
jgi:hypothetical protein